MLRVASGTVRDGRLTSIGAFISLGAAAPAGGAVTVVNGAPLYARTGSDRRAYIRTATSGWRGLPLSCAGRVALARGGGSTYAACRDSAGALRWTRDVGAGFGPAVTAGGNKILGDVGLAVDRVGRASVYTKGSDNAVYRLVIGGKPARWHRLGAAVIYGAAAAQIRP